MRTQRPFEDFAAAVATYLKEVKTLPSAETPNSVRETDRLWCESIGRDALLLPSFVTGALMPAAHQHLLGLARLSGQLGVDLAVESLARSCTEVSTRIMWVIDPKASSEERVLRSMNTALESKVFVNQVKITEGDLPWPLVRDSNRKIVGIQRRKPQRVVPIKEMLNSIIGDEATGRIWSNWSQASHGDIGAAISLTFREGNPMFLRAALILSATAHLEAVRYFQLYSGYDAATEELRRIFAPVLLSLLAPEDRRGGN